MKNSIIRKTLAVSLVLIAFSFNLKSQASFFWGKQFGSERDEYALNHVVDNSGNIYVAGKTNGNMIGKNMGMNDGFIIKIDSLGNTMWTKLFGTSGDEDIQWSAIDNKGCVYITGSTTGILGAKNFGKEDIFVVKYNPSGEMEWSRQFGTDSTDIGKGIYADSKGSVFVTGMTGGKLGQESYGKTDFFLMKLDNKGNLLLTSQFGTPGDDYGYALTGGNNSEILICGSTWGDLGARNKGFIDGFVGRFSESGKNEKYIQFGSEGFDIAMNLIVDDEYNIYVEGSTSGNFGSQQSGEGDCFLLKLNSQGVVLWNKQFGTKNNDGARGLAYNNKVSDNILVSGIMNLPPAYAFIRMYGKDGSLLWQQDFAAVGKNGGTSGKDVSIDLKGNFYHLGLTGANMFGPSCGEHDVYIVKYGLNKSNVRQ